MRNDVVCFFLLEVKVRQEILHETSKKLKGDFNFLTLNSKNLSPKTQS